MKRWRMRRDFVNKPILMFGLLLITYTFTLLVTGRADASETDAITYTVKASGLPYHNKFENYSTYTDETRQYYMLRSYLEQLEKDGGGTLVLSKGIYVITNTLYVPSNVTILLSDGVKIKKGKETGTSKLSASKSIFQLVAPSRAKKRNTMTEYSGESGISIIGEGKATIDLDYMKSAIAIVVGHNSDITIKGITFQRMYNGNFIKIAASEDVEISDNTFRYHKDSSTNTKEAVALEVPDAATKMFSYPWSKNDKTINQNITIENNVFYKLERAIGSTKYTEDKYQTNIRIMNNTISKTDTHAIRILNWENCVLEENHFSDITNAKGSSKAILISGVKYPTISNNDFTDSDRAIQIMPWKNNNNGSDYEITYNLINEENKEDMLNNVLINMQEYVIRYNMTYKEYALDTEKWEIFDPAVKDFIVTENAEPFQNYFMNYSTYNDNTKQYYVLRSYLEQLERVGGGTLTIKSGTYEICNVLYVPSHVTIYFEDGVTIKKTEQTGTDDFESSKSIFQLAAPSKSKTAGAYAGYDGETDIQLIGQGTTIIDLDFVEDSIGIVLGHNKDVSISGITFKNMCSGHFIELDASSNVTIENNKFIHHKSSETGIKEAINIDTPDKNTEGFNAIWTNFDCTPNKDIMIRDNYFDDLERAIGTHKYSDGKYHENVQIINNKISNTTSDAIRIMNWKNPIIKENEIKMVAGGIGNDRAILASGLINPTITENTFIDMARSIQIMPWKNSGGGRHYAITYNDISYDEISLMLKNRLIRVSESFIRVNKTYNVFDDNTDKFYFDYE